MTKSRTQKFHDRLRDLQLSSPEIEASALITTDGLTIASVLPDNMEDDRVAAMAAAMHSLGERITSEMGSGLLEQVFVHGYQGYVTLIAVGEDAVLTSIIREGAKLGLILKDMERASHDLEKLF